MTSEDRQRQGSARDRRDGGAEHDLRHIWHAQESIMGRLDSIQTALTSAATIAADEAAQVAAHLTRIGEQVVALQATVDQLVADQVTQAEIDTLQAQADALGVSIEAIDSEGEGPIVEPPPVVEAPPA